MSVPGILSQSQVELLDAKVKDYGDRIRLVMREGGLTNSAFASQFTIFSDLTGKKSLMFCNIENWDTPENVRLIREAYGVCRLQYEGSKTMDKDIAEYIFWFYPHMLGGLYSTYPLAYLQERYGDYFFFRWYVNNRSTYAGKTLKDEIKHAPEKGINKPKRTKGNYIISCPDGKTITIPIESNVQIKRRLHEATFSKEVIAILTSNARPNTVITQHIKQTCYCQFGDMYHYYPPVVPIYPTSVGTVS